MYKRIGSVFTLFDLYQSEKNLHLYHRHMLHTEKENKAKEIVRNHVGFAMGAALVPFPGADLLAVSAVQLNMLRQLAKLYKVGFMDALGKNVISAVVGSSAARLGASLIKAIPGLGTIIGELSMPVLSGASTYALGNVLAKHFHDGGTLDDFDLTKGKKAYSSEMEEGKRVAETLKQEAPAETAGSDIQKIQKLAEMRDAGILTEEEFTQMKARIIGA